MLSSKKTINFPHFLAIKHQHLKQMLLKDKNIVLQIQKVVDLIVECFESGGKILLAVITAIANDYGYDTLYERQVEGLLNKGDILIKISTSGNLENVCRAVKKAMCGNYRTVDDIVGISENRPVEFIL